MTTTVAPIAETTCQSWEYEADLPCGIVVGIDGSPESLDAFNTAGAIARSRRCALHAVSVIEPFPSYHLDPDAARAENVNDMRKEMRETSMRDLFRAAGADAGWTHEVALGSPARMLSRIAERRAAELIVVGRRRHGVLDRVLGGETTLQVMRVSCVPVLAVPFDCERPRSVVVATDFSEPSVRAARIACELLGSSGTLYMVYVEPQVELLAAGFGLPAEDRYPGDVISSFRRFTASVKVPPGIIVETVILSGKPVPAILEFAQRVGADMIAAGSHGYGRINRFLLGSTSTGFVRNADCPVLVAPSTE